MSDRASSNTKTSRNWSAQYQRAYALMNGPDANRAAARALLLECVRGDCGNLIFHDTFLQVLQQTPPSRTRWRGVWTRVAFERARSRGKWAQVVDRGLRLLVARPRDGLILCGVAEALLEMGHPQVARRYLLLAESSGPTAPAFQRRCANAYARLGCFDEALACWERVAQRRPDDAEAARWVRQLRTHAPSEPAGNQAAVSKRPSDPDEVAEPWQRLLEQGRRQFRQGDLAGARTSLVQAARMRPGELRIVEALEDLDIEAARQRVALAQLRSDAPDHRQLIADLVADLTRCEIEVFAARAARYPQEHHWKISLGNRLKEAGSYASVCQLLEEIPAGSVPATELHVLWGECLQHQRQFSRALRHYETAAASVADLSDETGQLAVYRAGVLALQMGDPEQADRHLRRLAAAAPGYKDLPEHLDKIASIRHKDGFSRESPSSGSEFERP